MSNDNTVLVPARILVAGDVFFDGLVITDVTMHRMDVIVTTPEGRYRFEDEDTVRILSRSV